MLRFKPCIYRVLTLVLVLKSLWKEQMEEEKSVFFIHRSFKAINVSAAPAQVKTNSGVLFSVLFGPGVCI